MDVNRASRLFREISREEISALFQAALGEGEIRTSRLLQGGLFNTTYYVEYGPEPRQAVLRLGPVNRHLLMGHERDLMAAEVRMGALCREAGVPCSRVLAWDDSRQSFGRDYMIAAYIPSVVMAEAPLPEGERARLRRRFLVRGGGHPDPAGGVRPVSARGLRRPAPPLRGGRAGPG